MPLFASRMSNLEAESCFNSGSAQETNAVSKTDGTLASECNMSKYRQKSTIENENCISAKNVDGDDSEPDLRMRRSRTGSTRDIDGIHVNISSGSDTERHPSRSKRRRETESVEDSAQTIFSNEKDVTFSTSFSDVFSDGRIATSF